MSWPRYGGASGAAAGAGSSVSALVSYPFIDDLAVVGSIAAPTASTPNNEYIMSTGSVNTGTDGTNNWSGHQSYFVRCADGTCFAVAFTTAAAVVYRSADGGTYGGAWTTVATINNSARNAFDLDVHLLRNPVTDHVHLIYTNAAAGGRLDEYRVRTWNNAGTQINDTAVPNVWPGSGTESNNGWFAGAPTGTAYSCASIGADGTIVLTGARSTGTVDGFSPTEMDALLRVQTMKWNGASWTFSPITDFQVGPRIEYSRLYVSPPGADGFIVGVGFYGVKFEDYNVAFNPNYNGTWANTIASSTYYGSGASPRIVAWKVSLDLSSFTQYTLLDAPFRTTDLTTSTPTPAQCQAVALGDSIIDSSGRLWCTFSNNGSGVLSRDLAVFDVADSFSTVAYLAAYSTSGTSRMHEDRKGRVWLIYGNIGSAAGSFYSIHSTTLTDSTLTAQTQGGAANLRGTHPTISSPFGADQTAAQYEQPETTFMLRFARPNNGSVCSSNWVDFLMQVLGDFTGTAPGDTAPGAVSGSTSIKRIRLQIPV